MVRRLAALPLLALLLVISGCKDPYGASERAAVDIGNGIAAGMKATDQLRVAGKINVQEETNILGYLKFANDANGAFASCATTVHTTGAKTGYSACAQAFQVALANPQELLLIKVSNPKTQQEVEVIINSINTGVSSILAALGGQ